MSQFFRKRFILLGHKSYYFQKIIHSVKKNLKNFHFIKWYSPLNWLKGKSSDLKITSSSYRFNPIFIELS